MPAKFEEIWHDQCAAAVKIRSRYGDRAALDYLVGEKLNHFVLQANSRPEFQTQLPMFIAEVRRMFTPQILSAYLTHMEANFTAYRLEMNIAEEPIGSAAVSELATLKQVHELLR